MLHTTRLSLFLLMAFVCTVSTIGEEYIGDNAPVDQELLLSGLTRKTPGGRTLRVIPGDYLWCLEYEEEILKQGGPFAEILKQLRESKVPNKERAEAFAVSNKHEKHSGIDDMELFVVDGLVKSGVDIAGFTSRGDLIWIVRFLPGYPGSIVHEAWINSRTAEVHWMLPAEWPFSLQKTKE